MTAFRSHSYAQTQGGATDAATPTGGGDELDEVESSIAAQAELIRKARLQKAKEKEKEKEEATKPMESGGGAQIKRRTTRRGSGSGAKSDFGEGVLVGKLIGQDHSNYVLMYNMLTGIRIGVRTFSSLVLVHKGS
jgi:hypothetical protein